MDHLRYVVAYSPFVVAPDPIITLPVGHRYPRGARTPSRSVGDKTTGREL